MTIVMFAVAFYSLPYYVTKPGKAYELDSIVSVEDGYKEKGELMLMTVRMGQANIYSYLLAKIKKYEEIYPIEEIRQPHENDEEYNLRQLQLMSSAKDNAIEVAYTAANKSYQYKYKGSYVLNVLPDMPADGILKPGDRIISIDHNKVEKSADLIEYVQGKEESEEVEISFFRGEENLTEKIDLKAFPELENKVGIGITLYDNKEIITDPSITLDTSDIGGPSAGLMFSLEIYNQLTEDDLTKGYSIAGTGTITPDGKVGRIGGIEQKVIAADRADAKIFFAPDDEITREMQQKFPGIESNYSAAVKTAKDIGTDMRIIPVKTFNDALQYLKTL